MLTYIEDQARLIRSVASPFLGQIIFVGKWEDSQMDRTVDWLEPVKWEMVDRELCDLMDRRLDGDVKLEVIFSDGALSREVKDVGCEQPSGAHDMLLNGVRTRGGVVKVQRTEISLNFVISG